MYKITYWTGKTATSGNNKVELENVIDHNFLVIADFPMLISHLKDGTTRMEHLNMISDITIGSNPELKRWQTNTMTQLNQ